MSAPARRAPRQSAYQVEKGLKQSLESVDNGLKRFLLSMQESGMAEGVQGYRAMQMVLLQQRLWAHSHSRTQLAPLFRSIAKTAGELHRLFSAYAEVMKPLKEIDRITRMTVGEAPGAPGDQGDEAREPEPAEAAPANNTEDGAGEAGQ